MNTAICAAIRARAVLNFHYDGGRRTVEPHCHGMSRADNEVLRGYQTAGYSKSEKPTTWKLFEVSEITGLTQTGATFTTNRPGYDPDDEHMTTVHCRV